MRGVAAHRLLLLRLTDSRSANHMCAPPTSTSAPLSSAFTFPPALVVSSSFLSRSPYPYRPSTCPGMPRICALHAVRQTLQCIPQVWLRQRVVNGTIWLSPQRLRVSTPTRLISFSPCMLLARPTAPPSHLSISIPFPPLLHRVLSARARASAHERRACARANTRNNAVDKHRTRAKLLRARAPV